MEVNNTVEAHSALSEEDIDAMNAVKREGERLNIPVGDEQWRLLHRLICSRVSWQQFSDWLSQSQSKE